MSEKDITADLEALQHAGFGGLEISLIYAPDAPGYTPVEYLSPVFEQRIRHAVRTARANNMDVDCILGTGWPYGGPWIGNAHRAQGLSVIPAAQRKRPDGAIEIAATGDLVALALQTRQQIQCSRTGD